MESMGNEEKSTELLANMDPAVRTRFLEQCHKTYLPAGRALFHQGSEHAGTYLLESGLVQNFYLSPEGKAITLAYWSRGDLVGGPDFFGRIRHMWSAETIAETVAFVIQGKQFQSLAREYPEVGELVIDSLSYKATWLSALVQIHGTEAATDRLAHLLVKLSSLYGEPGEHGIILRYRFTQQQLANMVGTSRQWVNMTLHRLEKAGLLRLDRRRIELLDVETLKQVGLIGLINQD